MFYSIDIHTAWGNNYKRNKPGLCLCNSGNFLIDLTGDISKYGVQSLFSTASVTGTNGAFFVVRFNLSSIHDIIQIQVKDKVNSFWSTFLSVVIEFSGALFISKYRIVPLSDGPLRLSYDWGMQMQPFSKHVKELFWLVEETSTNIETNMSNVATMGGKCLGMWAGMQ